MFRMWIKEFKDNRMLKDYVWEGTDPDMTRTKKVLTGLEKGCEEFDLSIPIWLDKNIDEFKNASKARFHKDNFIEDIEFDYLEIQVIEEDMW